VIIFLKSILYAAQGFALVAAIYNWKNNKHTTQKYFLHLMIFIALTEITANITRIYFDLNNSGIYNLYIIVSFIFFFYWFYQILEHKKLVTVLSALFILLIPFSLYQENFTSSFLDIVTYSGSIITITLSFLYLRQLLSKDEIIVFSTLSPFWISSGLLIFYSGFIPMLFLQDLYGFNRVTFQFVMTILNITLYGCFTKAFLCRLKK